jgi:hypothetical protein
MAQDTTRQPARLNTARLPRVRFPRERREFLEQTARAFARLPD